jgi:NAD dependent epimerase/dehydratase family enzyme
MSWIALADVVAVTDYMLSTEQLEGPVNVVAPNPVTNAEFTKQLGAALSRPTLFPMPAFGARLAFGEMADALLLSGQRVLPQKLQDAGYQFKFATLAEALPNILREK